MLPRSSSSDVQACKSSPVHACNSVGAALCVPPHSCIENPRWPVQACILKRTPLMHTTTLKGLCFFKSQSTADKLRDAELQSRNAAGCKLAALQGPCKDDYETI
eukprot:1151234-Pelagomonas_calceolata.AAC.11